jgi:hypothetical protein
VHCTYGCETAFSYSLQPKQKSGPKANLDFEREVLSNVVLLHFAEDPRNTAEGDNLDTDVACATIKANVAFSYEIIKQAALHVQSLPAFRDCAAVQALKFSTKWINSFIQRCGLSRRRISGKQAATRPALDEVRVNLSAFRALVKEKNIPGANIISADETAIFACPAPLYQVSYIFCDPFIRSLGRLQ